MTDFCLCSHPLHLYGPCPASMCGCQKGRYSPPKAECSVCGSPGHDNYVRCVECRFQRGYENAYMPNEGEGSS